MLERFGLQVTAINASTKSPFRSVGLPQAHIKEFIQVEDGDDLAIRVKVTEGFQWKKADCLEVAANLSSATPLSTASILRDSGETSVIDRFYAWDDENAGWCVAKFDFQSLKVLESSRCEQWELKVEKTGRKI